MRRKFYTIIKADHKLGNDAYVQGRVSGIMEAVCSKNPGKEILYGRCKNELGMVSIVKTTTRRYKRFAKIVESEYPKLCLFDFKRVK